MSRASCGVITAGAVVNEGENLGLMLMRRWPAAVLAALLFAALWSVLLAGPVLAQATASITTAQAPVPAVAAEFSSPEAALQQATVQDNPNPIRAVAKTDVPEGSPFIVQLIMIVVLIGLGIGYFKLMSHSGRRRPSGKDTGTDTAAEPVKDEDAHAKQPSNA